jgi:hypothetical protein
MQNQKKLNLSDVLKLLDKHSIQESSEMHFEVAEQTRIERSLMLKLGQNSNLNKLTKFRAHEKKSG